MSLIYEVNLDVDAAVFDKYQVWLKKHRDEVLALDGFESCQVFERSASDENAPNKDQRLLTLHYFMRDRASLDHYFNKHAARDTAKRHGSREAIKM